MKDMQHLRNTRVSTLYWIQPEWGEPIYELRSDDELFCTLRWSTYNEEDPASVVSANRQWTLMADKSSPRTIVQITDSSKTVAACKIRWSLWHPTATVEFVNGPRFRWYFTDWWRGYSALSSEDVGDLIFFKTRGYKYRLKIQVDLTAKAKELIEAPLLTAFGMYTIHRDLWRLTHLNPGPWWLFDWRKP